MRRKNSTISDGDYEAFFRRLQSLFADMPYEWVRFASDPRTLFRIGINFSAQTRNIEKWLVE